jgi:excisionase family DNA binding protein
VTERLTYSIDETARLLGVSRDAVKAAIRRRELPARKLGKRVLVSRAAVDAFGRPLAPLPQGA